MKEVEIELSGVLPYSQKQYFGGTYSVFERLRMGGVGSSKIIYDKGIPAFDDMEDGIENELSYVSFEILKNGLILRLNRTQKLSCVGVKLTEIEKIKLTAYRIELRGENKLLKGTKLVHRGELEILEWNGDTARFSVFTQNFDSLLKFFRKKEIVDKLEYEISELAPEKDYGHLVKWFDLLN